VAALFVCLLGCGSDPPPKKSSTGAVPRIAPPVRRGEVAVREPEPDEPAATAPAPKEKIPVGAWMQFSVAGGEPFECRGFLKLHVAAPASVLEIANYDAAHHEDFPSLHIRALVSAQSIGELVNKKLPAEIRIQVDDTGHLIHNQTTQPLDVFITEIDGKNVRGTFAGTAHDIALGGNGSITGKFQAVLE
jgi:hypothetical protein